LGKEQQNGEQCTMKNFKVYTLHKSSL